MPAFAGPVEPIPSCDLSNAWNSAAYGSIPPGRFWTAPAPALFSNPGEAGACALTVVGKRRLRIL